MIEVFAIHTRNQAMLDIFLEKVRREYARDVSLVFIYGSAVRDEDHEASDLDLVFVPQNKRAQELASCFLVGDIGYDFFPMSWARLERIASFEEPLVPVISEAQVVYSATRDDAERFEQLRGWIMDTLDGPLRMPMLEKAKIQLDKAMLDCAEMQLAKNIGRVRQHAGCALCDTAEALCLMNNRYFKRGDSERLQELLTMRQLPDDFESLYTAVVRANTVADLRKAAWALLAPVKALYDRLLSTTRTLTPAAEMLPGSYEEGICNWKHKIRNACTQGDANAAFLSGVRYQHYLDMFSHECGLPPIDIMRHFKANDLPTFDIAVTKAQAQYRAEMEEGHIPIREYESIDAYKKAMLE